MELAGKVLGNKRTLEGEDELHRIRIDLFGGDFLLSHQFVACEESFDGINTHWNEVFYCYHPVRVLISDGEQHPNIIGCQVIGQMLKRLVELIIIKLAWLILCPVHVRLRLLDRNISFFQQLHKGSLKCADEPRRIDVDLL